MATALRGVVVNLLAYPACSKADKVAFGHTYLHNQVSSGLSVVAEAGVGFEGMAVVFVGLSRGDRGCIVDKNRRHRNRR